MKIWTEISKENLAANLAAIQTVLADATGSATLLAVVKANAYGHGIETCAPILAAAGAQWLGVTDATEGARVRAVLRDSGLPDATQPDILVMSATAALPGEAEAIVRDRLTPVVSSLNQLTHLREAAAAATAPLPIHLEIDTGMSRQGVAVGPGLDSLLELLAATPQLHLSGLMTHFADTEVAHSLQTLTQRAVFEQAVAAVTARALRPDWVHVGNSSYIDNDDRESNESSPSKNENDGWLPWLASLAHRAGARPMVRSGLALYGHLLPIEGLSRPAIQPLVRPVLTWKTRVLSIAELPACNLVGYNGTYRATHPMRLALLPAGYADGLRRELSSTNDHPGGWVILHGRRAPIIGRISMNLTSVDISAIPNVSEGDEVTLLGEGITAEDHARLVHTIPYEILCGIRASCPTD
ncbi:alanine racemase [Granulicella aggregans]|uniref:alanine racemase n=1 Tax=Granulicella aggregans TaxID=474949 RepID=UPI0021E056D4|nr:alanine racemase [Granulicella aggregans]